MSPRKPARTTAPVVAVRRRGGISARPLLGLRRQPGRLALWVFRLPLPLYRAGWGWLFLGRTFLVLTHVGRTTGKPHEAAAMVLAYDSASGEAVICAVWGSRTDWIRNLQAGPALRVQIGRESFVPEHRFLSDEEALAVGREFRRRHPWRVLVVKQALGVDLRSDAAMREFVGTRPFVALKPTLRARAGVHSPPFEGR
jgi:deazaflavin-dependent oxidoreductase (nitroreductase family)